MMFSDVQALHEKGLIACPDKLPLKLWVILAQSSTIAFLLKLMFYMRICPCRYIFGHAVCIHQSFKYFSCLKLVRLNITKFLLLVFWKCEKPGEYQLPVDQSTSIQPLRKKRAVEWWIGNTHPSLSGSAHKIKIRELSMSQMIEFCICVHNDFSICESLQPDSCVAAKYNFRCSSHGIAMGAGPEGV